MSKISKSPAVALALTGLFATSSNAQTGDNDTYRLTASLPFAVKHFHDSNSSHGWNEGFLNNPGLILEADKVVRKIDENTDLRAGVVAGAYYNSIRNTSLLAGTTVSIETRLNDRFTLQAGTPLGIVSGYNDLRPAIAPYIGVSATIAQDTQLGLRAQWLPIKTAGSLVGIEGKGDAVTAQITLSRNF